MRFDFPDGMRPATVDERERFYREAFPADQVRRRMERWDPFIPVVDVGTESTRYRPRLREYKGKLVRLTDWDDMDDLREKIVSYAPEDLYYVTTVEREDRIETNPEQELVFDLDPENLSCRRCDMKRRRLDSPAKDHVFCTDCFADLARETKQLFAFLHNHFDDLELVHSGRGFHIHVMDDAAFLMDREDRNELAGKVASEFPIDQDVTAGDIDLVRLPGSLHGLVSRTATVLDPGDLDDPDRILDRLSLPGFLDTPA